MKTYLAAALATVLLSCTACAENGAQRSVQPATLDCGTFPCPDDDGPADQKPQPVSVSQPAASAGEGREALRIAEIEAMPAGSWLLYGRPWRDIDPGRESNCGTDFGSILGAWNGVLWDGRYVWSWAAGGHGDGCFNGIVRYDLATGKPEMVVPHLPLNVPLCRPFAKKGGQDDCFYEPYVSDKPFPGGMDQRVAEWDGDFLRPRSSHIYNNMVKIGDWIYLVTGHIYGSSKPDAQVWRFDASADDIASTIERLPDRFDATVGRDRDGDGKRDGKIIGSFAVNWVTRPGKAPLMFSGSIVCEPDLVAGQFGCTRQEGLSFSTGTTMAWDEARQGLWAIDPNHNRLMFARQVGRRWVFDPTLSVTDAATINKRTIGSAGICLVPTEAGTNPVIWGQAGALLRWDGQQLQWIDAPGGPREARRRIYNKWTWNEDLGVCWGSWTVDQGFWVYKPDFLSGTRAAAAAPAASVSEAPGAVTSKPSAAPAAKAAAQPAAKPAPPPPQAVSIKERWWIDPADYPVFAGHRVAPAPWQPAAWDQPIERQPEAPDYDALCTGGWTELHYRSEEDLAGSAKQMRRIVERGTPNVRVYLHPRVDGTGKVLAYANGIKFNKVQCSEIVGVPLKGEKPQLMGDVSAAGVGIIARGLMFQGASVRWRGNRNTNRYPAFAVLHDLDIYAAGHLMGDSRPKAPLTYLEFRGNVIGANTDWHVIYLERSIGQLVAMNNVFYGSGRRKHSFKNLAHQSRLEGNVFSNVGIDGQVLTADRKGRPIIGLFPLDLYLCTETVFRNNTVIFRTSGSGRSFMAYRGRRAWGNCDKGQRLGNGRWALWPPEDPAYQDSETWAEIAKAATAFDRGYEAAKAEPWLFTHKVEGNRFIVFNAQQRGGKPVDDTRAARIVSLRPVADNPIRQKLNDEARGLAQSCATEQDRRACVFEGMSDGLRYAYDHLAAVHQGALIANGELPRGVPFPAPKDWVERAGVYWGKNTFITCSADGSACRETAARALDAAPRPWDALEVAHPPRVIVE